MNPAGQGQSCGAATANATDAPASRYCAICGREADPQLRRADEAFCSEAHADEFAREVAAASAKRGRDG